MREFNIFGPVYPDRHYHVNRVDVITAFCYAAGTVANRWWAGPSLFGR